MQAHGFQQHLVAVGRAVKRAGAGAVVRGGLGLEQLVAPTRPCAYCSRTLALSLFDKPVPMGPAGTNTQGKWP